MRATSRGRVWPRSENDDEDSKRLAEKLTEGQRAMRLIRFRVTGTMLAVAILALILFQTSVRLQEETADWSTYATWTALEGVFVVIFITSANLAPLPTDRRLLQFLFIFHCFGSAVATVENLSGALQLLHGRSSANACSRALQDRPVTSGDCCLCFAVSKIINAALCCVVAFGGHMLYLCRPSSPLEQIERLFRIQKWFFSCVIATELLAAVACVLFVKDPSPSLAHAFCALTDVLMVAIAVQRKWREMITSRLRLMFDKHAATASAAGIACLIGGADVTEVLSQAKARFRGIKMSSLSEADLVDNKPSRDLFQRSFPASLGSVQYFCSHSWSDHAGAKWAA